MLLTACTDGKPTPTASPSANAPQIDSVALVKIASEHIDKQREIVPDSSCYWTFNLKSDVKIAGNDKTLREFLIGYINFDIAPYYGKQITVLAFDAVPQKKYMPSGQTQESAKITYVCAFTDNKLILADQGAGVVGVSVDEFEKVKEVCIQLAKN